MRNGLTISYPSLSTASSSKISKQNYVGREKTYEWLLGAKNKPETASLIVAAQDQALDTRYHQRCTMKKDINSKSRMCQRQEQHVAHIISGCTVLARTEYSNRHKPARYLHWSELKIKDIQATEQW